MTQVLITDDPFPFDSCRSVEVYIVSIDVSTQPDTGGSADSMTWVNVAAPHRQINLLTLQQGLTASLGRASSPPINTRRPRRHRRRLLGGHPLREWLAGRGCAGAGVDGLPHSFVEAAITVPDAGRGDHHRFRCRSELCLQPTE